eukprot:g5808.t1
MFHVARAQIVPPPGGFRKRQTLRYQNGYAIEEAAMLVNEIPNSEAPPPVLNAPTTPEAKTALPRWVELDRKVLRFYGYFVESVVESPVEDHRVRKIVIYYYLADDSIHVEEPKQDNSGLPQGVFFKRSKILKKDGSPYTAADIRVGENVCFNGRSFKVVDCDTYTRSYLEETLGYTPPAAEEYPVDPIDIYRAARKRRETGIPPNPRNDSLTRYVEAKLGKPSNVLGKDTLKKYLEQNRIVLRFWCLWDDRSSLYGQRRPYILHYFLEDDTGEILESFETNSGRDPFPVFQKRGPLYKNGTGFTSLTGAPSVQEFYGPQDFRIGSTVRLNNRDFFIYECDGFTKRWYQDNFGMSEEELATIDITLDEKRHIKPALPPHNGFGSLEDSKQNCIMLIPKPPKKDFLKLMNKDRIVLRFASRLTSTEQYSPTEEDAERTFIVTYFMADDTIAIFEKPIKNSGLVGGKFLERRIIRKPGTNEPYTYHDLYVGTVLEFHRRGFLLLDADEYTYTYMENNKHTFEKADAEKAFQNLKTQTEDKREEVKTALLKYAKNGKLQTTDLEDAIKECGFELTKHSIVSLKRKIGRENEGAINILDFLNCIGIKTTPTD